MLKVSFLCPISPIFFFITVVSNGDGFPLVVMDTAFLTFVMKVEDFLVLMRAAVVGVGVDGGVGGGVGGVDGGVGVDSGFDGVDGD